MAKLISYFILGGISGAISVFSLLPESVDQFAASSEFQVLESRAAESQARLPSFEALVEAEALARRAVEDPVRALNEALGIQDPLSRRMALERVGSSFARVDPRAGLAQAARLPQPANAFFQSGVAIEWASIDPYAFLDFADISESPEALLDGLNLLVATDPARVFEIATRLASSMDRTTLPMQVEAITAFAERDPLAALERLERMPDGTASNMMLREVAAAFARNDPDRALSWAATFSPQSPFALRSVMHAIIGEIAAVDFDRALDLVLNDESPTLGRSLARDPLLAAQFASAFVERDATNVEFHFSSLMSEWAWKDPTSAIDWLLANEIEVTGSLAAEVAQRLAQADVSAAIRFAEQLSPELRDAAIGQVAEHYAREDSDNALNWISQFQGSPGYDAALSKVVASTAERDAPRAARMLATASPSARNSAARGLLSNWARQDGKAAAAWLLDQEGLDPRSVAVSDFAYNWHYADRDEARNWALELRSGELRDEVLSTLIGQSFQRADFDTRLVESLSTDQQRETVVISLIRRMPSRDGSESEFARELLDAYVSDPELISRGEAMIELLQQAGR